MCIWRLGPQFFFQPSASCSLLMNVRIFWIFVTRCHWLKNVWAESLDGSILKLMICLFRVLSAELSSLNSSLTTDEAKTQLDELTNEVSNIFVQHVQPTYKLLVNLNSDRLSAIFLLQIFQLVVTIFFTVYNIWPFIVCQENKPIPPQFIHDVCGWYGCPCFFIFYLYFVVSAVHSLRGETEDDQVKHERHFARRTPAGWNNLTMGFLFPGWSRGSRKLYIIIDLPQPSLLFWFNFIGVL